MTGILIKLYFYIKNQSLTYYLLYVVESDGLEEANTNNAQSQM